MDNVHIYGFRWVGSMDGACYPKPQEYTVTSGKQFTATGNVDLNVGDPVEMGLSGDAGTVVLATAGGTGRFFGVVVSVNNARVDANGYARPASYLPGGTTWSTEATRSKVGVVPFGRNIWEIDVDDNVTATTLTAYRALINRNCSLTYLRDITNPNRPKANPLIDISTNKPATDDFRIIDISNTASNQDFSGQFVKIRVVVNETGEAPFNPSAA